MLLFRVRLDKNFLYSPSLVVRMKEKYTSFSTAAPLLVSLLMSKVRTLQSGSVWFSLVQSGSIWFSLVLKHLNLCLFYLWGPDW
jgi:hypothetical protein